MLDVYKATLSKPRGIREWCVHEWDDEEGDVNISFLPTQKYAAEKALEWGLASGARVIEITIERP